MAKLKKNKNHSWRDIEQNKLKRGVTPQSRFKRLKFALKIALTSLLLCCIVGIGFVLVKGYHSLSDWMNAVGPSRPLKIVSFESNGVLTREWANQISPFPWGCTLGKIDIFKIKEELESHGQVDKAIVERHFPETLKLRIYEVKPILRLMVKESKEKPTLYLLDEHGSVYRGSHYPKSMIEALPFLEGVQLQKKPMGGYFPIIGIEALSHLLDEARNQYPNIYKQWRSISCQRFNGRPDAVNSAIEIKTFDGMRIIFSPQSPIEQLNRLHYILQYLTEHKSTRVSRIDLTLEDQAAVELEAGVIAIPKHATRR